MSVLAIERVHTHAWVRVSVQSLASALVRIEEQCECGATRTRIGYSWHNRRR